MGCAEGAIVEHFQALAFLRETNEYYVTKSGIGGG